VQAARLKLDRPDFESRFLQLQWDGDPEVSASSSFAPGYEPSNSEIDNDALKALFVKSWSAWTEAGPGTQTELQDIALGDARLRANDIGWSHRHLFARFDPPGIRITNRSDQTLTYEVKAEGGSWGGPYSVKPGEFDTYSVGYPLTYRRRVGGRYLMYTLPLGSHSEFRAPKEGMEPTLMKAPRAVKRDE